MDHDTHIVYDMSYAPVLSQKATVQPRKWLLLAKNIISLSSCRTSSVVLFKPPDLWVVCNRIKFPFHVTQRVTNRRA